MCVNCVMDSTDRKIVFGNDGICDHCVNFRQNVIPYWKIEATNSCIELDEIIKKIQRFGQKKEFDCIIGMSGGVDSSYMLHVAVKEFGLRPLVFHVDGGWNSQVAVNNIGALVDKLGLDLYTEVINWEEMKDFQLSYFKAGVPNLDVPQDHAFISTLYNYASKHKIKYILNGGNFSTECVRNPMEWIYHGTDMAQIKDIRKKFGTIPLKTYPFSSVLRHKIYLRYIKRIQVVKLLNYVPYIKEKAVELLSQEYGWQPYPQKHFESRFTRFYEGYWLPTKFGYDTRKVQFSSLILTGQMTREEALEKLSKPAMSEEEVKQEFEFVATKLGITTQELEGYLHAPNKTYKDYKNQERLFVAGSKVMNWLGLERAIKR